MTEQNFLVRLGVRRPMSPSVRPGRSRAGFTIVEVVVVVMLIGVLTSIAAPRIDFNRFRMDSAMQSMGSAVMASRGEAILKQHDVILLFEEDLLRLRIVSDLNNNGSIDSGERERVIQLEEGVRFGKGGANDLQGHSDDISITKTIDDIPALIFRRNGSASEESMVFFTSTRGDAGQNFPQDTRALFVERSTGRVVCYTYRTLEWVEGC